jgi:dipeptidase E
LKNKDVIIISGGNSLYGVDRLKKLGVGPMIEEAIKRDNTILSGGSAGALCWFDGGHSDSMDPATYRESMLGATFTDESQVGGGTNKKWKYIRVPMFGYLPGLLAPHHDVRQSNGVLRHHDFDKMMLRHPGEQGICIDHWAAFVLNGDGTYEVMSMKGKKGSLIKKGKKTSLSEK